MEEEYSKSNYKHDNDMITIPQRIKVLFDAGFTKATSIKRYINKTNSVSLVTIYKYLRLIENGESLNKNDY